MKHGLFYACFFLIVCTAPHANGQKNTRGDSLKILFLGDSYTAGYGVEKAKSYPYQLVRTLNVSGIKSARPVLIAKSGWNSGELLQGITEAKPSAPFDAVFLLIGVNNQYRGYALPDYEADMDRLLKISVRLAGKNRKHVYVISIPDWGATPFAAGKNPRQMSMEIGDFNAINRKMAARYDASFIDIFMLSQSVKDDASLTAEDGLHPSGKMYAKWVKVIAAQMIADR